uniref:Uncharacterized protein n=1 Tax=Ananas comosus var. bracteatus TaxID=296719 RepID=A0A6V7PKI2_ANACO|nr:unnamed protein product [Ananas comosus var. bracteatus]
MAMDELKPYSVVVVVVLPIVVVFFFLLRPRRGGAGPARCPWWGTYTSSRRSRTARSPSSPAATAARRCSPPARRRALRRRLLRRRRRALLRGAHDPRVSDRRRRRRAPPHLRRRRLLLRPLGPYWRFVKKLCVDRLLGAPTLARLRRVRTEELQAMLAAVRRNAEETAAVDVGRELIRNVKRKIDQQCDIKDDDGPAIVGTDREAEDVRKVVEEVAELTGKFNVSDYIGFCKNWDLQGFNKRLDDVHRRFDTMVEKAIKEKEAARAKARERQTRKEEEEEEEDAGKDLLDILLDIYEDEGAEMRLSRENIKAFILDIFVAGTDTSAITIEWALAELINHPDILRKAVAEIDSVVGKHRLVNESDIPNLPYLQAIVKETLRLHPTGPLIVRKSSADCTVSGCHIPAGRHSSSCPGTSLAMLLVQAALGAMLQCFEWRVEGGTVDMAEGPGITLPRASPLVCTPVVRLDPFLLP